MTKLYEGDIGRLVIFAAPSGTGKTTFLMDSTSFLKTDNLPTSIEDFHQLAPKHENIMDLKRAPQSCFDNLCLHVDLSHPIRWLEPKPDSREKLLTAIKPEIFSNWKELKSYSERASEIIVITLFVRREEHHRRWTGRALNHTKKVGLHAEEAAVNGDLTNKSELHRKVYRAWDDFVVTISPRSHLIIDGNAASYTFMSKLDYQAEINSAYRKK